MHKRVVECLYRTIHQSTLLVMKQTLLFSPSINHCLFLISNCGLVNNRKTSPPFTHYIAKENQKGQKTERSRPLIPLLNALLSISHLLPTPSKQKPKESPTHNLQTSTVPTPPRPHASPTPNPLHPPALTPTSPRPSSPILAAQPRQPTSTSPLPPMPPPPPHPQPRTNLPTSQSTLTSLSVSAAYS